MMILVINKNAKTYTEGYKLFYHKQEAIDHANSLGFSKYSMVGLSIADLEIGKLITLNVNNLLGRCDIEIIVIEPECNLVIPESVYGC
jgi:hypothetical protein